MFFSQQSLHNGFNDVFLFLVCATNSQFLRAQSSSTIFLSVLSFLPFFSTSPTLLPILRFFSVFTSTIFLFFGATSGRMPNRLGETTALLIRVTIKSFSTVMPNLDPPFNAREGGSREGGGREVHNGVANHLHLHGPVIPPLVLLGKTGSSS